LRACKFNINSISKRTKHDILFLFQGGLMSHKKSSKSQELQQKPVEFSSGTVHNEQPSTYLVQAFKDHILKTNHPESFMGIRTTHIPKSEQFVKLCEFQIDPSKRADSKMAYCPMCHQTNKFSIGTFAWLPHQKCIAAIGNECADKKNRLRANQEFRNKQRQRYCEDYLLETLPKMGRIAQEAETFLVIAKEAQLLFRAFKNNALKASRLLKDASKQTGRLSFFERAPTNIAKIGPKGLSSNSNYEIQIIDCGRLYGTTALLGNYCPLKDLSALVHFLNSCVFVTNEDIFEKVCSLNEKELDHYQAKLQVELKNLEKAIGKLKDFAMFFGDQNIAVISKWFSHELSGAAVRVTRRSIGSHFLFRIWGDENQLAVKISNEFIEFGDRLYNQKEDFPPALHLS
jgi:hypothetical protein